MILEALRIVKNALSDGTIGVNAQLPGVPRDGTDPQPASVALIAESTSNFSAAIEGLLPDVDAQYPCLMLCPGLTPGDDEPVTKAGPLQDGSVEVLIRYGAKDPDAAAGNRDASYTLRAVRRSLNQLQMAAEATRLLNGIYFMYFEGWTPIPFWQLPSGLTITNALRVRMRMRDTLP